MDGFQKGLIALFLIALVVVVVAMWPLIAILAAFVNAMAESF